MSELSSECAAKRTPANASEFIGSRPNTGAFAKLFHHAWPGALFQALQCRDQVLAIEDREQALHGVFSAPWSGRDIEVQHRQRVANGFFNEVDVSRRSGSVVLFHHSQPVASLEPICGANCG
jgi:hypothetical protein